MASSSSSSSSSFSSPRKWVYDVFPSFSGEDVRRNFLSHFLKELDRKLIIAFKDNEIERSKSLDPELKLAIRTSRIAVVVFSEKYASSSWCLNELLEIVRCKEEFGQMVIPVFYRLDPSHVRKQTGEFGKIFEEICKNSKKTENEIKLWQKTLTDVANVLGYHSQNWDNEAKMIEDITNDVLKKLLLTTSKAYENFVGIEKHMVEMSALLNLESEEVRMVGIWGSSGIGKTTIARALYGRISRRFQGSVYIDKALMNKSKKIYGSANPDDYNLKLHLQRIFLSKILDRKEIEIDHLGAVEERLKLQKVLIFIDDLNDQVVLDTLVGHNHWFGSGSRIIVITQNKHFLRAHGIGHIYEVCLPSKELALEMFCQSAFRRNYPPDGFMDLASEVALRAGNLPLGLNVLGSSLRGRDKEDWIKRLPGLRNELNGEIEQTLRVSYDGLKSKKDKAIFRHIACFFNGERVTDINLLLEKSDLDFDTGLENLVDKSLVQIRDDIVEMHRLLQEMGKEIVRAQSNEPGEREFLVDSKDICDLLEDNTGTEKVLGIRFELDENDEFDIHESAFERMRSLLYLKLHTKPKKDVRWNLPDGLDYLPSTLRLLSWEKYPLRHLPSKFRPKNLVKLQMQESKLEKLWDGVHSLRWLKDINLHGSKSLKTIPDLSRATNLVTLDLCDCSSLEELPSSIQYLNKLEKLVMSGCRNLETIPPAINLQSLYRLDLNGCSRLRSFPDISSNIRELVISETAIDEFPSNLRLENLVLLTMSSMKSAKLWENEEPLTLLMNMVCPSLEMLYLSDIPSLVELPSSIEKFDKLEYLSITNCINLETLPTDINLQSLGGLDLSGCSRLRSFPDISRSRRSLRFLFLRHTSIEEVPWWIENFSELRHLSMKGCNKLHSVSLHTSKLKYLNTVDFSDCGALIEARLNGCPSAVAMEPENIHSKLPVFREASPSLPVPDDHFQTGKLDFFNCFKLDQEALIQKQSVFCELMMFSGEEVPSYFNHCTTGRSLIIHILRITPSQPLLKFKVCAVVDCIYIPEAHDLFCIQVEYLFLDRHNTPFTSVREPLIISNLKLGSQLVIFECSFLLNEDGAPLDELTYGCILLRTNQIYPAKKSLRKLGLEAPPEHDVQLKLKEWGIQVPPPGHELPISIIGYGSVTGET